MKTSETTTFALKITLDEINSVCPGISHSFIFDKDAKIIAKDEETTRKSAEKAANNLNALTKKAETIGGIESIKFQTTKDRIYLACTDDYYTTIVTERESNEKYVNTLTQILVPVVLKLAEQISKEKRTDEIEAEQTESEDEAEDADQEVMATEEELGEEETVSIDDKIEQNIFLPEPTATQFMVENVGGLLVSSDTVQIDNEVVLEWNETYGEKKIIEVELENLTGLTTRCKFKPLKGSKNNGRGIIKIPKKIQLTIQVQKGELVTVKPVVD